MGCAPKDSRMFHFSYTIATKCRGCLIKNKLTKSITFGLAKLLFTEEGCACGGWSSSEDLHRLFYFVKYRNDAI